MRISVPPAVVIATEWEQFRALDLDRHWSPFYRATVFVPLGYRRVMDFGDAIGYGDDFVAAIDTALPLSMWLRRRSPASDSSDGGFAPTPVASSSRS